MVLALTFSGSIFAQYESHWADLFDMETNNPYEMPSVVIAFIQIDGNYVTAEGNWADLEVGFFYQGTCRGHVFLADYTGEGDPYPIIEAMAYYDQSEAGNPFSMVLYDHATGIEYGICKAFDANGETVAILMGDDHYEPYYYPDESLVFNFTNGIDKEITAYTGDNDHYYLLATPMGEVDPAQVTNMLSYNYDLYYFDQNVPATEWISRKLESGEVNEEFGNLQPGKGYLYANSGEEMVETVTLTFPGFAYTQDVTVTLNNVGGVDFPGWNLIGNPFNENLTLTRDFLVMNADGNDFTTVNRNYLEPMEGAFVFTEEEEEELTLYYPGGNAGSIPGSEPEMGLAISQGHGVIDRAVVRFGGNRTLPKFQLNPNHTKVYIPQEGKDYAVVSAGEMGEMPVNFKAEKSGTYTMSFSSKEVNFAYLHLIDNMTGNDVDLLATPAYTFDARNTDYASRFKLVFVTSDSNDENFAYFNNGNLIVSNDGEATLQVVDVMGRILSSETISGTCSKHINAAKGVYMIRVINGNDVKVQKIVVE